MTQPAFVVWTNSLELVVPFFIWKAGGLSLVQPTIVHLLAVLRVLISIAAVFAAIAVKGFTPPHSVWICGQPTRASSYLWFAPSGSNAFEFT